MAHFYEYAEERCLFRKFCDPYQPLYDLIALRMAFYAPLPLSKLNKVTPSSIYRTSLAFRPAFHTIRFENKEYPIPETFVRLVKAVLHEHEPIIKRDIKSLGSLIESMCRSKELKLNEPVNLSIIKKGLKAILRERILFSRISPNTLSTGT